MKNGERNDINDSPSNHETIFIRQIGEYLVEDVFRQRDDVRVSTKCFSIRHFLIRCFSMQGVFSMHGVVVLIFFFFFLES